MKPPPFDYAAAETVDEALDLLATDRDARVIAGGQSLLPILNLRLGAPEVIVDIGGIAELRDLDAGGEVLTIGAGVTQTTVLRDPAVGARWPLLAAAVGHIGHAQIRNRGTVCGSLAHNDPQAELPAVALALDAEMTLRSRRGERRVAAADFFTGTFTTVVEPDELLTAVHFGRQPKGWSFREFAVRPGDFALAGVVCLVDAEAPDATRVVLFGLGSGPVRATPVEARLAAMEAQQAGGDTVAPDLVATIGDVVAELGPLGDVHASATSRRELAAHLIHDAVVEARRRASASTAVGRDSREESS